MPKLSFQWQQKHKNIHVTHCRGHCSRNSLSERSILGWITICYWIGVHVFVCTTIEHPGGRPATFAGSCTSTKIPQVPLRSLRNSPTRHVCQAGRTTSTLADWGLRVTALWLACRWPKYVHDSFALVSPTGHVCPAGHSLKEAAPRIIVSIRM